MMKKSSIFSLLALCFISIVVAQEVDDVVELTNDTFEDQTETGFWVIEFFAPWCSHCKALEPTWKKLATEFKGRVQFASVDCTVETAVCKKYQVTGYPTIKAKVENIEGLFSYRSDRSYNALRNFALQTTKPSIEKFDASVLSSDRVKFVAFYDDADIPIQSEVKDLFEKGSKIFNLDADFYYITESADITTHFKHMEAKGSKIFVVKDDSYYLFDLELTEDFLYDWMNKNKLPLLPELGKGGMDGAKDIYNCGKDLVLLVLDGKTDGATVLKEQAASLAKKVNTLSYKSTNEELFNKYQFVWIDGSKYHGLVSNNFGLGPQLPQIVVWNPNANYYYLEEDVANGRELISSDIELFLQGIAEDKVPQHGGYINSVMTNTRIWFYQLRAVMVRNPVVLVILVTFPIFMIAITCSYNDVEENKDSDGNPIQRPGVGNEGSNAEALQVKEKAE